MNKIERPSKNKYININLVFNLCLRNLFFLSLTLFVFQISKMIFIYCRLKIYTIDDIVYGQKNSNAWQKAYYFLFMPENSAVSNSMLMSYFDYLILGLEMIVFTCLILVYVQTESDFFKIYEQFPEETQLFMFSICADGFRSEEEAQNFIKIIKYQHKTRKFILKVTMIYDLTEYRRKKRCLMSEDDFYGGSESKNVDLKNKDEILENARFSEQEILFGLGIVETQEQQIKANKWEKTEEPQNRFKKDCQLQNDSQKTKEKEFNKKYFEEKNTLFRFDEIRSNQGELKKAWEKMREKITTLEENEKKLADEQDDLESDRRMKKNQEEIKDDYKNELKNNGDNSGTFQNKIDDPKYDLNEAIEFEKQTLEKLRTKKSQVQPKEHSNSTSNFTNIEMVQIIASNLEIQRKNNKLKLTSTNNNKIKKKMFKKTKDPITQLNLNHNFEKMRSNFQTQQLDPQNECIANILNKDSILVVNNEHKEHTDYTKQFNNNFSNFNDEESADKKGCSYQKLTQQIQTLNNKIDMPSNGSFEPNSNNLKKLESQSFVKFNKNEIEFHQTHFSNLKIETSDFPREFQINGSNKNQNRQNSNNPFCHSNSSESIKNENIERFVNFQSDIDYLFHQSKFTGKMYIVFNDLRIIRRLIRSWESGEFVETVIENLKENQKIGRLKEARAQLLEIKFKDYIHRIRLTFARDVSDINFENLEKNFLKNNFFKICLIVVAFIGSFWLVYFVHYILVSRTPSFGSLSDKFEDSNRMGLYCVTMLLTVIFPLICSS